MTRPTWDEMKLARDGHLWVARYADNHVIRPLYETVERTERGTVMCTFADGGAIEYGPASAGSAP